VRRTTVPKATVYEDSQTLTREHNIDVDSSPRDNYVFAKSKASAVKGRSHGDLERRLLASIGLHRPTYAGR
jgi:hypothetical protein